MKKLHKPCPHRRTVVVEESTRWFGVVVERKFTERCARCNTVLREWEDEPEPAEQPADR